MKLRTKKAKEIKDKKVVLGRIEHMMNDSVCSKAKKSFKLACPPIKILRHTHSLNVNYIKIFKPRYSQAVSPEFFYHTVSNYFLVILSRYLIMASNKLIITLSYLGMFNHLMIIRITQEYVYHKTTKAQMKGQQKN